MTKALRPGKLFFMPNQKYKQLSPVTLNDLKDPHKVRRLIEEGKQSSRRFAPRRGSNSGFGQRIEQEVLNRIGGQNRQPSR